MITTPNIYTPRRRESEEKVSTKTFAHTHTRRPDYYSSGIFHSLKIMLKRLKYNSRNKF